MQQTLSKEHLACFAKQTVNSICRLISPGIDNMTLTQQDLLSTSKAIEGMWRKKKAVFDVTTAEQWAISFCEELRSQLEFWTACENSTTAASFELSESGIDLSVSSAEVSLEKKTRRNFISESSMLMCTEVLKILIQSNEEAMSEIFTRFQLLTSMTAYLVHVPMSKKMRNAFALVLLTVAASKSALFEEFLSVSNVMLVLGSDLKGRNVVTPQQVHLAWLLATVFRRVDMNSELLDTSKIKCAQDDFLSGLIKTCVLLTTEDFEGLVGEGTRFTAFLAYFGLVIAMVRGCAVNKALCRKKHYEDLTMLWVNAASNLWNAELTFHMPTNVTGKDVTFALEGVQFWASELVEFIVEVTTSDSFSLKRQTLHCDLMNNGSSSSNGVGSGASLLSMSQSPVFQPGTGPSISRYEPLPTHWYTLLTGGSDYVWNLASLLFNCVFFKEGCCLITEVLLRLDTQNNISELIYRNIIVTLMLLCMATPRNAEMLAESPIIDALIILITHPHKSAFLSEVVICGKPCLPLHPLNVHSVQITLNFMCLLSSLYVAGETLPKLLRAVEEMSARQTVQTDADIIESFLHVFSYTGTVRNALFFPGNGSVVCKVDRFLATYFSGYSFATWIYPMCVWTDGSHLFSFTDGSVGTVVLMIVANGRSCSLMLRIENSRGVTLSTVPDTTFPANAWTNIVFTHSMSGFTLFINGKRNENNLSVPFPKVSSKKDRLQIAFGGCHNEPSFFGLIASIDLFDGSFSDKDVQRMYKLGPRPSRELSTSCHSLLSVESQTVAGTKLLSVGVTGSLAGRNEGVSVHSVLACSSPNTQEAFVSENVVEWALRTIANARKSSANFSVVARLCVHFVCTAMKLATNEELQRMVDANMISRLGEDIQNWEILPTEIPALLISCTIPQGSNKIMRSHHTTQIILSLLLDLIGKPGITPMAIFCILRELSDSLLFPENVVIFRMVTGRFEQILDLSLQLPLECVEHVITLVERLCKEPREMEQTLRFLLSESSSKSADFVKAEMLRMLFDIALTNTAMCDLIVGAFANCGIYFLILLVGGKNHSSELIRIFSLCILSLIQNTNKRLREPLIKFHIYEIITAVITNPSSLISVRLQTFNCLFGLAFDAFQPTTEGNALLPSLEKSGLFKPKRRSVKHPDHKTFPMSDVGQRFGLQGYMPGLLTPELRVTRREYSFDISYDFSCANESRFPSEDLYRVCASGAKGYTVLHAPQAIQIVLSLLGYLLNGCCGVTQNCCLALSDTITQCETTSDEQTNALEDRCVTNTNGDNISTSSALSPTLEETPETVALRVLDYLQKIVDSSENGEMLLPLPWLQWMWGAVGQVITVGYGNSADSSLKLSKKHVAGIQQLTRNIVRSLAILDLSRNAKAGVVRSLRQGEQPPLLTRLVIEEIVSHFTKNRCEISNQNEAANIIKNLDLLFNNIKDVLDPLPLGLGLDIVNSISAIAVNNNSWVRMRMKNSSHLFETRNQLSFLLLASIRKFSKPEFATLGQLLKANVQEQNTIRVLLYRLVAAVSNCDADEVEVLLLTTRQFISGDPNHYQAVLSIIGPEHCSFAELVCGRVGGGGGGGDSALATDVERDAVNVEDPHVSVEAVFAGEELLVSDVIRWCREDEARWDVVRQRVHAVTKSIEALRGGSDKSKDLKKNRLAKLKRVEDRRQGVQNKIAAEVERITREVNFYLNTSGTGSFSTVSTNTLVKTLGLDWR